MAAAGSGALRQYLAQQVRPPVQAQIAQYPTVNDPLAGNTSEVHQQNMQRRAAASATRQSMMRNFLSTQ